jgi:hypothetical protein
MMVVAIEMPGGREVASLAELEAAVCDLAARWRAAAA